MSSDPRVPGLLERMAAAATRVTVLSERLDRAERGGDTLRTLACVGLALASATLLLPWGRDAQPRDDVLAAGLRDVERYAALSLAGAVVLVVCLGVTWAAIAVLDRWPRYTVPAAGIAVAGTLLAGVPGANVVTPGDPTIGSYLAVAGLALTAAALFLRTGR
ncbi:MAG: hypothetical protein GEV07_09665 [Streptosporangiales bacterium]|nr:hypothetical protein [Streptosporangiales bacterium]